MALIGCKRLAWRGVGKSIWTISVIVFLFLYLQPIAYRITRIAIMSLALVMGAGALVLWWKYKWLRFGCSGIVLVVLLIMLMPGWVPDAVQLRGRYIKSLLSYDGTTYIWGGENHFGIDCSGLVRRGMIDALLKQGLATANPALIRQSFVMRWFDCSAAALQNHYRNQTRTLFSASSIQEIDPTRLQPGDLAVTVSGVHILAYLGDQVWIEADPGAGRVIKVRATDENPWLKMPVEILRWRILELAQKASAENL